MSAPITGFCAELDSEVVYSADVNDREIQRQIKQQVDERLKQTEERLIAAIQKEPGNQWREFGKKLFASYLPPFIAVVSAMSVLIVGVSYFVKPDIFKLSEQVTTIKEAVEKQERKVDDLNKDIRDMLNDALQRTYPDKGTSPAKSEATTRGALNDARNIIALAAKTGVLLSPESLTKVGSKALADADERPSLKPLAWQVASEALTLASRVRNPAIFRQQLPECQPPTNFEVEFEGGGSPNVILKRTVLERCAFTLDLPPGEQKFVIAKEVVFKGCLIRYSGGDVRLEGSLVFEDCVFQFGVTNEPPPIGRRLAGTLLASQLTRAETRKP